LVTCIADQTQLNRFTDASLCHGWAGLLHSARCGSADAVDPERFDLALLERELHNFLSMHGMPYPKGLLTGSTGIQLVAEPGGHDALPTSAWDQCLLTGATPADPDTAAYRVLTVSEGVTSGPIL